jgi:hypothetical protein
VSKKGPPHQTIWCGWDALGLIWTKGSIIQGIICSGTPSLPPFWCHFCSVLATLVLPYSQQVDGQSMTKHRNSLTEPLGPPVEAAFSPSCSSSSDLRQSPLLPSIQSSLLSETPLFLSPPQQRYVNHKVVLNRIAGQDGVGEGAPQGVRSRSVEVPSPNTIHVRQKCSVAALLCEEFSLSTPSSPRENPAFSPDSVRSPTATLRPRNAAPLVSLTMNLLQVYTTIQVRECLRLSSSRYWHD